MDNDLSWFLVGQINLARANLEFLQALANRPAPAPSPEASTEPSPAPCWYWVHRRRQSPNCHRQILSVCLGAAIYTQRPAYRERGGLGLLELISTIA